MSSTNICNSVSGSTLKFSPFFSTLIFSFPPITYPLIKTTHTSSVPKYSMSILLISQPSVGSAFSDSISSGNICKVQAILSFYTSTGNSSFSQSAPDPAVTWSSTTIFTSHPTPLSGTGTFPPSTAFSRSTVKTDTSGRWRLKWSLTVAALAQFGLEEHLRENGELTLPV